MPGVHPDTVHAPSMFAVWSPAFSFRRQKVLIWPEPPEAVAMQLKKKALLGGMLFLQ
jgi:hypothetical protein